MLEQSVYLLVGFDRDGTVGGFALKTIWDCRGVMSSDRSLKNRE